MICSSNSPPSQSSRIRCVYLWSSKLSTRRTMWGWSNSLMISISSWSRWSSFPPFFRTHFTAHQRSVRLSWPRRTVPKPPSPSFVSNLKKSSTFPGFLLSKFLSAKPPSLTCRVARIWPSCSVFSVSALLTEPCRDIWDSLRETSPRRTETSCGVPAVELEAPCLDSLAGNPTSATRSERWGLSLQGVQLLPILGSDVPILLVRRSGS
mmetsp:Transcript_93270/g.208776  ORF Transcript_93270/g.208776 Transcript_93270/m.208776 type:complete len:208 (-) Transcript_93270:4-627(-)